MAITLLTFLVLDIKDIQQMQIELILTYVDSLLIKILTRWVTEPMSSSNHFLKFNVTVGAT
jgi:hypothetical protein